MPLKTACSNKERDRWAAMRTPLCSACVCTVLCEFTRSMLACATNGRYSRQKVTPKCRTHTTDAVVGAGNPWPDRSQQKVKMKTC